MTPHQPGDWRHLAEQMQTEMDSDKLMELATELNRVLGEREQSSRKHQDHGDEAKSYQACA